MSRVHKCFNSTIVRLNRNESKENKPRFVRFNSTIVRLNQAYLLRLSKSWFSFNSTIVRLNLLGIDDYEIFEDAFQFYNSPIKSRLPLELLLQDLLVSILQ